MPAAPAIAVDALVKRYAGIAAVDGCSFTVEPGEVFGLLGPNGAGKTTTVEILEGYRDPGRRPVRVLGLDPQRDGAQLRPRIGVMLQAGGLYPGLRPLELLRLFAAYYDDPESPERLLDIVGLRDSQRTPVRRLSGGQAQRLSLACALIGKPEVVFLDEPTAGMDPHAARRRGSSCATSPHAARPSCSRRTAWTRPNSSATASRSWPGGRLAALGTPAELTQHAAGEEMWFAATPGPRPHRARGRASACPSTSCVEERPGEYVLHVPGTPQRIADLALFLRDRDVTLAALQAGRRSLEEVFLQITAEATRERP